MTRENLSLEIDSIVVYGGPRLAPERLRLAIEEELRRLFEERGIPLSLRSGTVPSFPSLVVSPSATIAQASKEIAAELYNNLTTVTNRKPRR